ncbi:hypothetical protein Pmani_020113 [Petrolisthes manimaculis]|uniref:Uncharacterized protein n=1 Tax=Petrolisthes manimaculis TaxID=1843537 RepID=A0AAE1PJ43_9EUCA|nr:hypothetical protein Pmani_020113 [Petrolisthes manimaculis]
MVYLYVPMLLSLLANCGLLLAARYVRSAKLRRLEKGPGWKNKDCEATEMQQRNGNNSKTNCSNQRGSVNNGQTTVPPPPNHSSGLRTHQTRNLWSESVKLVIWSGGTWLLEVVSFVVARYGVVPSESWYDYLWYVPSSINSLRGVGIFFILVFTPENRLKLSRWLTKMGLSSLARNVRSSNGTRSTTHHRSSSVVGSRTESSDVVRPGGGRGRNMSIATVITQLSSIKSSRSSKNSQTGSSHHLRMSSNNSETDTRNGPVRSSSTHPNLCSSVSQQTDTRRSSLSSQSSMDLEGYEYDLDSDGGGGGGGGVVGGRRRSSLATVGVSLPSVHEEEHDDDLYPTSVVNDNPNTNTTDGSASDA